MTDPATAAQVDAADPLESTWLSANAGSGKTRVLTNRVARLLLKGTNPRNILCLTYTKAAASEMQNRLFATLGKWAMLEDGALRQELRSLGESPPDSLAEARTLFARAIETPGGLRIQTIHSLCAAVLRQFPLEGEVSPRFRELDDAQQLRLIGEVLDELAETDPSALVNVARFHPDDSLVSLAQDVSGEEDAFGPALDPDEIFETFGVPPGLTCDQVLKEALGNGEIAFLREFRSALPGPSGPMDLRLSSVLADLPEEPSREMLETLSGVLLYGKSAKSPFAAKIDAVPTKKVRESEGVAHLMPRFNEVMQLVETARDRLVSLDAATKSVALHRFAQRF
ncbi:MAG: UvrD-helicase domain-containing protein, partial [Boseongicola sp.]|nr:UvrD-helicase domain-containing protein [Boseongicola sp.]